MMCEVLWRLPDLRSIFALAATCRYMKQMVDHLRLRRVELPERRYKYEFVLAPENLSFTAGATNSGTPPDVHHQVGQGK
jgi:hypothetical protein